MAKRIVYKQFEIVSDTGWDGFQVQWENLRTGEIYSSSNWKNETDAVQFAKRQIDRVTKEGEP